jgi:hypothetical protein
MKIFALVLTLLSGPIDKSPEFQRPAEFLSGQILLTYDQVQCASSVAHLRKRLVEDREEIKNVYFVVYCKETTLAEITMQRR